MRKLVYATNTTLDGFMAGASGEPDFGDPDDELHDFWAKELDAADTLLLGRVMYQMLESYWPTAASDPSISQSDRAFADKLNPMPKIVFSKTLDNVGWNTRVVRDNIGEEVQALKEAPGDDLALSCGPDLLATFLELGLIDEIRLLVHPVAIGRGKSVFGALKNPLKLKLVETRTFESGRILHTYQPAS